MLPSFALNTIHIGPLVLYTWGVFAGLAFAAALFFALKEAKRKNIKEDYIFDLAVLVLAGGIIGARGFFIFENWDHFSENLFDAVRLSAGGLMYYGGALVAILLVGIYLKRKKLNGWSVVDILTPSFAIGEFIGRIGCALGDLHVGAITALPWGQEYFDGTARHPISIYMALNGFAMFIVLWFLRKKIKTEGALFMIFVLWYSGTRFFLDFLRCDDLNICDPRYSGWTPSQYISGGAFIISLIYLILIIRRIADKKHMAEQQKENEANKGGVANENKVLQDSAVNYIETEEVIFENNGGDTAVAGSAGWKSKTREIIKKPWAHLASIVIILALGAAGASVYYNKMYYGEMFKKSPFSFLGKTWVAFEEPIVALKILTDKTCEKCDISDIIKDIKTQAIPTLATEEIDYTSQEGKNLIESFKIKSLPVLFFDTNIEKVALFGNEKFKEALENKNNLYRLDSAKIGIPQGKFLELPKVSAEDRVKGPESASVTIIEFSDFECPYCKQENDIVKQVLAAYPDKVKLVFKHLPLPIHTKAQAAAEAAECAGDQGKFFEMADILFAKQDKLDAAAIAGYARTLKLDGKKFKECVDSGKFKAKIANDSQIAAEFGVGGTPAFFIGNEYYGSAMPFERFKEIIDAQLAK